MSTIEQNLIGNTAGLSRVDKALRWFFLLSLIGLTIYSIGGIFFGTGVPLRNDGLAMTVALLAYLTPGYSRTIPGVHRFLRACEWAVMGCSLVCNVSMIAAFAALCFFVVLIIAKDRARHSGPIDPAG